MAQVFISYSRKDIDFVRRLATDLQNSGIHVWWDLSGIQGSDIWERKIEEGLNTSQYFIIVLTPDSIASRWVRREYLTADSKGLRIIPLTLKPHGDIPLTLRDIQPVDAIHRSYEDVLCELLRVMGIQPRPAPDEKSSGQNFENQAPKIDSKIELMKLLDMRFGFDEFWSLCDEVGQKLRQDGVIEHFSLGAFGDGRPKHQLILDVITFLENHHSLHYLMEVLKEKYPGLKVF